MCDALYTVQYDPYRTRWHGQPRSAALASVLAPGCRQPAGRLLRIACQCVYVGLSLPFLIGRLSLYPVTFEAEFRKDCGTSGDDPGAVRRKSRETEGECRYTCKTFKGDFIVLSEIRGIPGLLQTWCHSSVRACAARCGVMWSSVVRCGIGPCSIAWRFAALHVKT